MITLEQIKNEKIRIAKENNIPYSESALDRVCFQEFHEKNGLKKDITIREVVKNEKYNLTKRIFNIKGNESASAFLPNDVEFYFNQIESFLAKYIENMTVEEFESKFVVMEINGWNWFSNFVIYEKRGEYSFGKMVGQIVFGIINGSFGCTVSNELRKENVITIEKYEPTEGTK
jgi:hypothetical protein